MFLLDPGHVVSVSVQLTLMSLVRLMFCVVLNLLSIWFTRVLVFDQLDHLVFHLVEGVHELLVLFLPTRLSGSLCDVSSFGIV